MRGFSPFTQKKKSKSTGSYLAAMTMKKCPTCDKIFQIITDGNGNWSTGAYDKHVASHKNEEIEKATNKPMDRIVSSAKKNAKKEE